MSTESYYHLPKAVVSAIPSEEGQKLFFDAFMKAREGGSSETLSYASAWVELEKAGFQMVSSEETGNIEWIAKSDEAGGSDGDQADDEGFGGNKDLVDDIVDVIDEVEKRQLAEDQYTEAPEAIGRSVALGLRGAIHMHEVNGIAVYMPGATHDEYLAQKKKIMEQNYEVSKSEQTLLDMFKKFVFKKKPEDEAEATSIIKMDDEQRIVWGWASVVTKGKEPVFDTQGDYIPPEVMSKAANEFMLNARVAKTMHQGDQVGEVIHSLPLTYELAKSLGIKTDREGWIVAFKVHDDEAWNGVKKGALRAFSIGGKGLRELANA